MTIPYDLGPVPPDIKNRLRRTGALYTCPQCHDEGHVCEEHPDRFWGGLCCDRPAFGDICVHGACHCGGAGAPCPRCCSPVPEDGSTSITLAFTPDWKRA